MEMSLRRYLWLMDGAAVALAAFFVAQATSLLADSALWGISPVIGVAPGALAPMASSWPRSSKEVESILSRNLFCSTCPPILEQGRAGGQVPPPARSPVATTLPLRLVAIMFAPRPGDQRWSTAIIRDTKTNRLGCYAVEDMVRGATIKEIRATRVHIDRDGSSEYLDLVDQPAKPDREPRAAAAVPARAPDGAFAAELDQGIKMIDESTYEVRRSAVDLLLGSIGELSRSIRIVPEVRDGEPVGFRLLGVKREGALGKIGLQNGDMIAQINGIAMTSPDRALEAYTKLRSANHLSVGIEHNGQKVTRDYVIR